MASVVTATEVISREAASARVMASRSSLPPSRGLGVREGGWKVAPLDGYRAQRVIAGEPILPSIVQNTNCRDPLFHLSTRPLTQVPVQAGLAARKNRPEAPVLLSERLESVSSRQNQCSETAPDSLANARRCSFGSGGSISASTKTRLPSAVSSIASCVRIASLAAASMVPRTKSVVLLPLRAA